MDKEFWIVENQGRVEIARCDRPGGWRVCGDERLFSEGASVRPIRRIDIPWLIDHPDYSEEVA